MQFRPQYDICIIPFSPVTENDLCEIRFQCRNDSDTVQSIQVSVYLDCETESNRLFSAASVIVPQSYGFWKFKHSFSKGAHTLIFIVDNQEETIDLKVEKERQPVLTGGFIMLGPPNDRIPCDPFRDSLKKFSDQDWEAYIDVLKDMGIEFIIIMAAVQRLKIDTGIDVAHYNSRYYPKSDIVANDPLAAIFKAAERNHQKVFMGLGHTYDGRLKNTTEIMYELYEQYGKYASFFGWYQSEEANFHYFNREEIGCWDEISNARNELSPVMPLLISPYFICREDSSLTTVNEELLEYLENNPVDFEILMPQDMVGQRQLTVKRAESIWNRLSQSCHKSGIHLWANCEGFNFDENRHLLPRFEDGGFWGPEGFVGQIEALYKYSEKTGTFMLSGFFTPQDFQHCPGGQLAVTQYENYITYKKFICSQR